MWLIDQLLRFLLNNYLSTNFFKMLLFILVNLLYCHFNCYRKSYFLFYMLFICFLQWVLLMTEYERCSYIIIYNHEFLIALWNQLNVIKEFDNGLSSQLNDYILLCRGETLSLPVKAKEVH